VKFRFSVVIPLYNKARQIENTIRSVLAQDFQDFEIIVVDDGSTDGGSDLIIPINDTRIRLVFQVNAGVSAARNFGVHESSAEYIAFLDADDEWYPWHLEEIDQLIRNFPQNGMYSVAHHIIQNNIKYSPSTGVTVGFCGVIPNVFKTFGTGLALVNSSTACVNRQAFNQSGGFPIGVTKGEDVYLWLKIALSNGIAHSARVCAIYNKDATNRSNAKQTSEIPYYFRYLADVIISSELNSKHRKSARVLLFKAILFTAAGCRLEGNDKALKELKKFSVVEKSMVLRVILMLLTVMPQSILLRLRSHRHARS
jgi:glycosyltransferase involved in cell wall biosynthesis